MSSPILHDVNGLVAAEAGAFLERSEYDREIRSSAASLNLDYEQVEQRARKELESGEFTSAQDEEDCEALLERTEALIRGHVGPSETASLVVPTLNLQRRLWQYDRSLAEDGEEVAALALRIAERVDDITGVQSFMPHIWAVGTIHDVGNILIDHEVIRTSQEGKIWLLEHMRAKVPHSLYVRILARLVGLPDRGVGRPAYANHAKQFGMIYGDDIVLDLTERRTRDDVADADGGTARLTRDNTRNEGLDLAARRERMLQTTAWRRGDYLWLNDRNNPDSITSQVAEVVAAFVDERYSFHEVDGKTIAKRRIGKTALIAA